MNRQMTAIARIIMTFHQKNRGPDVLSCSSFLTRASRSNNGSMYIMLVEEVIKAISDRINWKSTDKYHCRIFYTNRQIFSVGWRTRSIRIILRSLNRPKPLTVLFIVGNAETHVKVERMRMARSVDIEWENSGKQWEMRKRISRQPLSFQALI